MRSLLHGALIAGAIAVGASFAVPQKEYRRRQTICEDCDDFTTHRPGFCGEPFVKTDRTRGCSIYIKAKLADEHCPQGKW